jgi:toxin ParE1/3/4
MPRIALTERAHSDLQEIVDYSTRQFGEKVAEKYLDDIEAALMLLQEHPELLKNKEGVSGHLKFHRVRQHFLVCAEVKEFLFVLTIKHAQMDIPNRIAELEPSLLAETEMLHARLAAAHGE